MEFGKRSRVLLVVLLLAAGIVLVIRWGRREAGQVSASSDVAPLALPDSQSPLEAPRRGGTPELAEVPPSERRESRGLDRAYNMDQPPVLRGTVVVTDDTGREFRRESGRMTISRWPSKYMSTTPLRLEVMDGAWETRSVRNVDLQVHSIVLGDRPVVPEDPGRFTIPEDGVVEIRARWVPATMIHVLAADTGRNLDGVELVLARDWTTHGEYLLDGNGSTVLLSDANSPIDFASLSGLPYGKATTVFFADSPGYAWGRIEVDLAGGNERFLRLERGGDLTVEVRGHDSEEKTFLRLWRGGETKEPYVNILFGVGHRVELGGLPVGEYRASLEIGPYWPHPVVLAGELVEIVSGRRSHSSLYVDVLQEPDRVPLSGAVLVPSAWGVERIKIVLIRLGEWTGTGMQRFEVELSAGTDTYAWKAPEHVHPGRFQFAIDHPPFSSILEVSSSGRFDADFEVPPPAEVSVRFLDAITSERVEQDWIRWSLERPAEGRHVGSGMIWGDSATGLFEFQAPEGVIEIWTAFPDLAPRSQEIEIVPGRNEVVLHVEPAAGFVVVPIDPRTNRPISWGYAGRFEVREVGGDALAYGFGRRDGQVEVTVPRPGRYRFTLPALDGYLPVPEQEVLVERAAYVRHEFVLQRAP